MSGLRFTVTQAQAQQRAALPTIVFRLRIECDGEPIEAMVLRAQLRIEPQWRAYDAQQQALLNDMFGTPERWDKTLHTLSWADVPVVVPAFTRHTEVNVPVACTYDFDVTATRYLSALPEGDIPLRFLFSGSVFRRAQEGFSAEQVPWECECGYRMQAGTWQDAMKACYGDAALLRVDRETFDALHAFRARSGLTSWEHTFTRLLNAP